MTTALRRELREAGVDYAVVKNTLLKRAVDAAEMSGLDDVLNGTTALAVSDDYVAAAKILCKYAEGKDHFKVKAGFMDGQVIDADKVVELSKLPSKEGLLSMLLSVLNGRSVAWLWRSTPWPKRSRQPRRLLPPPRRLLLKRQLLPRLPLLNKQPRLSLKNIIFIV